MSVPSPLSLPDVTICAVTSRAVGPTIRALRLSMEQINFADAVLITHKKPDVPIPRNLRIEVTDEIESREAYSLYLQTRLSEAINSPFMLLVQWDGYILNADRWSSDFLDYDYIGAVWPQFEGPFSVGNGGFSLRSKRLLDACRDQEFRPLHPEDISICHVNRVLLESKHAIRFAPEPLARRFSFERARSENETFGFHGVFNMMEIVDTAEFDKIYDELEPGLLGLRELCDLIASGLGATSNVSRPLMKKLIRNLWRNHATRAASWAFVTRYVWNHALRRYRHAYG